MFHSLISKEVKLSLSLVHTQQTKHFKYSVQAEAKRPGLKLRIYDMYMS